MERKYYRLKLSDVGATGEIEGHGSVANNVDLGLDVVRPGAFVKTLKESRGKLPILFNHDPGEPIGVWAEMHEDATGLRVKGQLNLEVERAREIHALLKQGAIKGLSIGYSIVKDKIEKGVRHLLELKLYEVSVVTFPMNELAQVDAVKAEEEKALAPRYFRLVKSKQHLLAALEEFRALLEEAENEEPGDAAHSADGAEDGAAETIEEPGHAHSDDPEDLTVLLEAIRSATPSPQE